MREVQDMYGRKLKSGIRFVSISPSTLSPRPGAKARVILEIDSGPHPANVISRKAYSVKATHGTILPRRILKGEGYVTEGDIEFGLDRAQEGCRVELLYTVGAGPHPEQVTLTAWASWGNFGPPEQVEAVVPLQAGADFQRWLPVLLALGLGLPLARLVYQRMAAAANPDESDLSILGVKHASLDLEEAPSGQDTDESEPPRRGG